MPSSTFEDKLTDTAGDAGLPVGDERIRACDAAYEIFREYSREKPEVVAMWAFGLGFVLGWKLKFW